MFDDEEKEWTDKLCQLGATYERGMTQPSDKVAFILKIAWEKERMSRKEGDSDEA